MTRTSETFLPLAWATLLSMLTACGGGSGASSNQGGGGAGSQLTPAAAKASTTGAQTARDAASSAATLAVDAARTASTLATNGQALRTYGTLTQDQGGNFAYGDTPTDRLTAVLADGRRFDLFITRMAGDIAGGGVAFFRADHDLEVRVVSSTTGNDLTVQHSERNRQGQGRITGSLVFDGNAHTVDLTVAGTTYFDSSVGSFHYELDERVTGSLVGAHMVTVDDTTHFALIGDSRRTSSHSWRRFQARWQIGTSSYELRDGYVNRAFGDGQPHELDTTWQSAGTLLRDGQTIGTVRHGVRRTAMTVWLDLGGGNEIELEAHAIR